MANGQDKELLDGGSLSFSGHTGLEASIAELQKLIETQAEKTEVLYAILQMQIESLNRMAETYRRELDACKTSDSLNRFVETCRLEVANYRREFEAWKKDALVFQQAMADLHELRQQFRFKREILNRRKGRSG